MGALRGGCCQSGTLNPETSQSLWYPPPTNITVSLLYPPPTNLTVSLVPSNHKLHSLSVVNSTLKLYSLSPTLHIENSDISETMHVVEWYDGAIKQQLCC